MFVGFNLYIDESADIFRNSYGYTNLKEIGEKHLRNQKAQYETDLIKYVTDKEIDGSKIQNEWFPQIDADIFISHSHKDRNLACALAGWLHTNFGLKCFIDFNVWGYCEDLLEDMNSRLSDKRSNGEGGYLYNHQSANQVSQHVNAMLSIALQKMIDKVETVIFLNTHNAVQVCTDSHMNKTYSPWIYSEIISTQIVRKKPLLVYRHYATLQHGARMALFESAQSVMQWAISYSVSLKHLVPLNEDNLNRWKEKYDSNKSNYDYALDALYEFMCPGEVEKTQKAFGVLNSNEIGSLKHAFSSQAIESGEENNIVSIWEKIISEFLPCCYDYNECRFLLEGKDDWRINEG